MSSGHQLNAERLPTMPVASDVDWANRRLRSETSTPNDPDRSRETTSVPRTGFDTTAGERPPQRWQTPRTPWAPDDGSPRPRPERELPPPDHDESGSSDHTEDLSVSPPWSDPPPRHDGPDPDAGPAGLVDQSWVPERPDEEALPAAASRSMPSRRSRPVRWQARVGELDADTARVLDTPRTDTPRAEPGRPVHDALPPTTPQAAFSPHWGEQSSRWHDPWRTRDETPPGGRPALDDPERDDDTSGDPPSDGVGSRLVSRTPHSDMTRETGVELGPRTTDRVGWVDDEYLPPLTDPATRDHAARAAVFAAGRAAEASAADRADHTRSHGDISWERAGLVVPVLGVAPGVGASVTAAALFDTLDAAGIPTLLVDAADPARSGLARAVSATSTRPGRQPHPDIGIAYAKRGGGWVAHLVTEPDVILTDSMVPTPRWWLPLRSAPTVTVVDLGWDPWGVVADPCTGAGAWLECGYPMPRPLLVTTASRPSLAKANEFLSRLTPWAGSGLVSEPAGLVVVGARRWPRGVAGMASHQFSSLLDHAVFLPHDHGVARDGVESTPLPRTLRAPLRLLMQRWGLPVPTGPWLRRWEST